MNITRTITSKLVMQMDISKQLFFKLLLCTVLTQASFSLLNARPISYPDSWTFMQKHNWEKTTVHVHYSPNAKNSMGYLGAYYQKENDRLHALQWNHLVFRNNEKKSQSNLYSKIHLGRLEKAISEKNVFHGAFNLSYDWETRKHFFLYTAEVEYTDDNEVESTSFHQIARIGIAPYVAPYGEIHTWFMLQFEHHPDDLDSDNHFIITPMVRFFKGDYLCEIGLNSNNQLLFNSIIRF